MATQSYRIDPALYISLSVPSNNADRIADARGLARRAFEAGKSKVSDGEIRQWGAYFAINLKARVAGILAEDLGLRITDAQAFRIAGNYLSGVHSASGKRLEAELCACVELSEAERRTAQQIGYHAWKSLLAQGQIARLKKLTDEQIETLVSQGIALGEDRFRKDWKSTFSGVIHMAKDVEYGVNSAYVADNMSFAQCIATLYAKYGPSLVEPQ